MIYVSGANGQLGSELRVLLQDKAVFLTRDQLDFTKLSQVENFLSQTKMDMFINAAGYTAVDLAESNRETALMVNTIVPGMIAKASKKNNFKLIHYSSDYVFDGSGPTPYTEEKKTDPVNYYGETKALCEKLILEENDKSLILRTSWVYSSFGKNFIKTILKLGHEKDTLSVVYDQVGSLTSAAELAKVTLASRDLRGIYHYSSEGVTSWYDVAVELKRISKFKASILPILSEDYPTAAKRPHFSVLNKQKLKTALDITVPHWTESLELCLQKLS